MLKALFITRPLSHRFPLLHRQFYAAATRGDVGSSWTCSTSVSRPGWAWRPKLAQQRRLVSNQGREWYDWYKRLGVRPDATDKEIRNAYRKRAMIEHPDRDKSPDTFENLLDKDKRRQHDQERLTRQKAAAAAAGQMGATLRAKWKAEEEAQRKVDDLRKRDARQTAREGDQRPKAAGSHGPKADSHSQKQAKTKKAKETPQKEEQRQQEQRQQEQRQQEQRQQEQRQQEQRQQEQRQQEQRQQEPEETEEDRLRRQKAAEDWLARQKAAADEAIRQAEKARKEKRLQERVVYIEGIPPKTDLADLLEPLVDLTPGDVFDARLLSARIATIEFCTDAAARSVIALAKKRKLYIRGTPVTSVQLMRSKNKIPAVGSRSRVVTITVPENMVQLVDRVPAEKFLEKHGLRVERAIFKVATGYNIRLASWTDAGKAKKLLEKHLPDREIIYGADPCGTENDYPHRIISFLLKQAGAMDNERTREAIIDFLMLVSVVVLCISLVDFGYNYWSKWWGSEEDESKQEGEQEGEQQSEQEGEQQSELESELESALKDSRFFGPARPPWRPPPWRRSGTPCEQESEQEGEQEGEPSSTAD